MKTSSSVSKKLTHNRALLCFGAGLSAMVLGIIIFFSGLLWEHALTVSDSLYTIGHQSNNIVVLGVDDKSLQEIGRWPWDRKVFADLIGKLQENQAIGIDISFFEGSKDDDALSKAINQSKVPIILVSEYMSKHNFLKPSFNSKAKTGHVNLIPDVDGVIRSMPMEILAESSFSSAVVQTIEPVITSGNTLIKFSETPEIISISDIINNKQPVPKGKIVLIGVIAPDFHDDHLTPINKQVKTPGVMVHANIIAALQKQEYLRNQSLLGTMFAMIILSLITILLYWLLPLVYSIILTTITLSIYFAWAKHLFVQGIVVDLLHSIGGTILVAVSCTLALYFAERAHKRWVANVFGQYVSKEVAHEIMQSMHQGADIGLGGQKRELTIMFSDIRGFTTLSETLTPEKLVELLNEYLSAMTEVIMGKKGIVDKYIGDAIMAFWNAPVEQKDHALQACYAALGMSKRLKELQEEWKSRKQPEINIGIGINTGDALVGNMGSKHRLSYTAMGDSVNLASRLEGLTKEYGVQILISESTHKQVKDKFVCRKLDLVAVKGKKQPILIYELIGELNVGQIDKQTDDYIKAYEKAFALYVKGDFKKAKSEFGLVLKMRDNKVSHSMIERCEEYIKHKPKNWDGVHVMKTK